MALGRTMRGTLASLAASSLFGVIYYYATLLHPLGGLEIYGWRILSTLPFLTLFMKLAGYWPLAAEVLRRMVTRPGCIPPLCLSSFLMGIQIWLFMWAPLNNKALDVSLGYLLMPLAMVVCGRLVYGDELRPFQKAAVLLAALGVANQVVRVGGISWATLVVALGYPLYFILRKKLGTDNLGGLWVDMTFMLPAAALALYAGDSDLLSPLRESPRLLFMLVLLGAMSALSIALFVMAGQWLSLSVFGLLCYVEPVLLVAVSLVLGERVSSGEGPTYLGVGLAVAVLALGGARGLLLAGRGFSRRE